jgi:transposase
MRSVGLDLGSRKYSFCEVSAGRVIKRETCHGMSDLQQVLGPETPPARVAIEACRETWHLASVLRGWGHEPIIIDTTRVRQLGIGAHGRKTDRIDAEVLAQALEAGRVPVAHLLSPGRQQMRYELGIRSALVDARAKYVVMVRHVVRSHGQTVPSCTPGYFAVKVRATSLSPEVSAIVRPLVELIEQLDIRIVQVDAKLVALAEGEPLVSLLMTTPGVALIVAMAFVSVIDDARRFRNAHEVEAYLGLVPSEYSSGATRRIGSITKQGNPYLRELLLEAAHSVLRRADSDSPLNHWAQAVRARRGIQIAAVALARRLAGVLWAMWRDDTVYEPARLGLAGARGLRREAQRLELRREALLGAAKKIQRRVRRTTRLSPPQTANAEVAMK